MNHTALKLLLIDDSPSDAALIGSLLDRVDDFSFEMSRAKDLKTASRKLTEDHYDAVLLDLNLPDSSGLETYEKLRADNVNVPIIIISGLEDRDIANQALSTGADNYLIKDSFDGNRVALAVLSAIKNRHQPSEIISSHTIWAEPANGYIGEKCSGHVLVVDRDTATSGLVRIYLTEAGFTVDFADDGYDALDKIRLNPPDVLLTEILIPKLDGLTLCRLLKEDPVTAPVHIVIVTILDSAERALSAGADAFVKKPLEKSRLMDALKPFCRDLGKTAESAGDEA